MDGSDTLRRKATRCYESAASAVTGREAERLNELGRQLEMWADDLDEGSSSRGERGRAPS